MSVHELNDDHAVLTVFNRPVAVVVSWETWVALWRQLGQDVPSYVEIEEGKA